MDEAGMKLEDQVAIVTGAGRNIGEAIAKLFAEEGAKVAVVDMDEGRGAGVAEAIRSAGGEAISLVADVSVSADVQAMVAKVVEAFGGVDILVNNVAITDKSGILDISEEEWRKVLDVTLTGPFLVTQAVARRMVEQGRGGKIVNVGSTSGYAGRPRAIAYQAAKGGLANVTKSMAVQLAPHKIRVNQFSPNMTGSPVGQEVFDPNRKVMNLAGRVGQPIDQARVALFLASDDSDFIVGENIFVDGGTMATASFA